MEDCVLDLCCGSGDLAFLLSEKVDSNGGKVGNLDFSKDQLFMASKDQIFFAPSDFNILECVEDEATDLPFQDCCFDAIPIGYGFRKCGG
ncbi:hypothetical protein NC653_027438 [Populus alba x Populus x berolinensis]|uniref:Methyltransferase domain-containing protein n=1 Tax=Populus alba x Populus x berolinensis TaxID=444605 RepID=A0AAD6Q4U8_9ROSI|nr:hypothetical protein NC653_027438 [Populus alba x Populus x berolinensis]